MGKTSRFIKALFGFKTPVDPLQSGNPNVDKQPKRRWSFFKSQTDKSHHRLSDASITGPLDTPLNRRSLGQITGGSTNQAVIVAATNAADAAVAAAHAAAEMVRMSTRSNTVIRADYGLLDEWAAIRIQSYFRGYLSRKALRALKSLVKLQALVRGQLQRKLTADGLRHLQAFVRVQARARASRVQITESPQSTTKVKGPQTPEKFEQVHRSRIIKYNQSSSTLKNYGSKAYDECNEKPNIRRRTLFQPEQITYSQSQSLTNSRGSTINSLGMSPSRSYEVTSLTGPLKYFGHDIEEQVSLFTTQNSPPFYEVSSKNGSMRVGPFTPTKSDSSRSCLSGYSDHPNYMAYTESSLAKVRSVSAPRQRANFEFPSTTKRYSVYGNGSGSQRGSNLRDSFASKAYPGSGRLDRLGMPVGGIGYRESDFGIGYWN